ncbi:uncharacterized protein [Phaseolus vulgaris]|uniref:uncharacterized protein n=1 Tax=Phaseolus vulgaris TaxID=3885 RepID=UPI0035CB84A0
MRYQAIEKAALAVFTVWHICHYFQSFTVIVMTDLPIRKVLQKPDIAGRMVRWVVELFEFDVQYEPRGLIKGQVYADFMVKLSPEGPQPDLNDFQWVLSVDVSSNQHGSGSGAILEGPNGLLIKQPLRFAFKASNNKVEYDALIVKMLLAKELGAQSLLVKSDSLLVTGQVMEPTEAKTVKRNVKKYTLIDGKLFCHGYTHAILTGVSGDQCTRIMEELHEGICRSHDGGRALSLKVIRVGYYWPTMKEDCMKYAQRCEHCRKHVDWHHAPVEELRSIYNPWPFHIWGIKILGPFPLAIHQMKYLTVAIEYFTKWIEVEPVAQITAHKVQHFVWKNIVCRFGIPRHLVSDNRTQFASKKLHKLCSELDIK